MTERYRCVDVATGKCHLAQPDVNHQDQARLEFQACGLWSGGPIRVELVELPGHYLRDEQIKAEVWKYRPAVECWEWNGQGEAVTGQES